MTTCNGRPTKPRSAAGRDREALAKVVADVEDLAGELALAYQMEAPHLSARAVAALLLGARPVRQRLAALVAQLPAGLSAGVARAWACPPPEVPPPAKG
jgi:hypothetical protein